MVTLSSYPHLIIELTEFFFLTGIFLPEPSFKEKKKSFRGMTYSGVYRGPSAWRKEFLFVL